MSRLAKVIIGLNLFFLIAIIVVDLLDYLLPSGLLIAFATTILASLIYALIKKNLFIFFFKRVLSSFIVIFFIGTMTFAIIRVLPGGPFDEEKILAPQIKLNIEKKYGLDQPFYKQYGDYMVGMLSGDLGYSYKYEGQEIFEIIKVAFPISFKLGLYALILAFVFGIPLGVIAAAGKGTSLDKFVMFIALSGISLPSFLLAPILIYIFSFGWPLSTLTPHFYKTLIDYDILLPVALWQSPKHYILPVITLCLRPVSVITRLTRASALDIIDSDFVRTARSKGLSKNVVLYQHILRNSLVPVLTYAGPLAAGILSGSFVVEVIFAIPGIAKYFVQAVFNRDYPLIMALTLLFSVLLISANLLVDLVYKIIDPRIEVS